MLRSECRLTHRNELNSAEAPRAHLVALAFLFPLSMLKTAEQTPQVALSYLPLRLNYPLPHADKLLHLRLVVLPPEPLIGPPAHPLGLLRERLRHVRAPSEPPADVLCPVQSSVHPIIPLALVREVVAVSTQEVVPRSVKDCHPPAASGSGTDESRPLPSEVARRPGQGYGLSHVFPFSTRPSPVAVEESQLVPVSYAAD